MHDTHTHTDPRVGTVLQERYRLTSRVAAGGMATVYRATDEVLGRQVAVKVMHPALASDDGFVERFRREAQHAARLNHPNIVTVHDWGRQAGDVFMVMEFVEGTSLRELLDRYGRLDLETVKHVVAGVAAALDHAHVNGLVHRDVKPENVLLAAGDGPWAERGVKVVDFGVARALGDGAARLTSDTVVGTMHYIAPEQLDHREADARSDVYALGVMTYEMLAGEPAFTGDTPAAVAAARLTRSVPSPGVSPRVDGAIARATAVRPEDRTPSAGEFAAEIGSHAVPAHLRETLPTPLEAVAPVHLPTTVIPANKPARKRLRRRAPTAPKRRAPGASKRRRWPVAAAAALLALLAAGGAALALVPRQVAVPDVSGRTAGQAAVRLQAAGLEAGKQDAVFDDAAPGTVLGSRPKSGVKVRRGTRILLVVSKGPDMRDIPDVTGRSLEEASAAIAEAGFVVGDVGEAFNNRAKGTIVSQDPAPSSQKAGTRVDLVVSKGPELIAVPPTAGKTKDQAKAAITGAGFAFATGEDYSDTVPEGEVIRTNPDGGERAAKGSTVTAVISKGPKPFAMPDLTGMDRSAAKQKAASLGLVVGNEYAVPGSGKPKGQIQGQNPPAGTQVRKGSKVDLYYAA